MIVKQYIKDFENLGFGMFVHFGAYSVLGQGEWAKFNRKIEDNDYEKLVTRFCPDADWADELVKTAKDAGCKYITLTTRHHDGFSLYDTCGLNTYDAPHCCGRDLVREFVNACNANGIIPFFYHTLLDWHHPEYNADFPEYLKYLRASVEILCRNYGKIGGLWFDGKWNKPTEDWEEDALYALIRSYQPEAMIINNTGLGARGELGNIELDSVTFERGKPQPLNLACSPKYIASEMCETIGDHWGYARDDFFMKSPAALIEELCECRKYRSNFLLNVGPMSSGKLRSYDIAVMEMLGQWTDMFDEAIRVPAPTGIVIENKDRDFILRNGNELYIFCFDIPMASDLHVALAGGTELADRFELNEKISSVAWLDNGEALEFTQNDGKVEVKTEAFKYGENMVVRVAKITVE